MEPQSSYEQGAQAEAVDSDRRKDRMRPTAVAAVTLALVATLALTTCSDTEPGSFRITAAIGDSEAQADGYSPGDPLAGGVVRLYIGDDTILETDLDANGSAEIDIDAGTYTVQVVAPSGDDPGCFWGDTLTDIDLPRDLTVDVFYICSGDE